MACLFPYAVKNPRYHRDKVSVDQPFWINVPCGKCPACLKAHANAWYVRLKAEADISETAYFVTITYAPEHVPVTPNGYLTLRKEDVQKFFKRLRKRTTHGRKILYYLAGEYGGKTSRPHYHAIILNADESDIISAWSEQLREFTSERNPIGDIQCDRVEGASINYTLKYIHKGSTVPSHKNDDRLPEFSLMSKGLGKPISPPQLSNIIWRIKRGFTLPSRVVSKYRYRVILKQKFITPTIVIHMLSSLLRNRASRKLFDSSDQECLEKNMIEQNMRQKRPRLPILKNNQNVETS